MMLFSFFSFVMKKIRDLGFQHIGFIINLMFIDKVHTVVLCFYLVTIELLCFLYILKSICSF